MIALSSVEEVFNNAADIHSTCLRPFIVSHAGRLRAATHTNPGGVWVLFDDQSNMKIKTAGPATIPPGGKVKSVHEAKAEFKIDFEDGSSATLCLADPGSSVAVRDKNNAVEYLG
jgi:hypothetical protein